MSHESSDEFDRRGFLQGVAVVASSFTVPSSAIADVDKGGMSQLAETKETPPDLPEPEAGYQSLGPDEVEFVEAMVNVMCPADHLTPSGVDCGLAIYIDRQLAGGFGKGDRLYMHGPWKVGRPQHGYQLPLTPEQFFKLGVAAANAAAQKKFGRAFSSLAHVQAEEFLHEIAGGTINDEHLPLDLWFDELVYPLFVQACFADPIYGGNVGKVFWRMIGYPGLPAVHAEDMVQFRGKPYPGEQNPMAIGDFS
jgi:gluconate 2-dehydrogenase gamma chain